MALTVENVLSALGLLGIGGALGTYFRIVWERKSSAQLQKQEFKDARYKCIIMLMYTMLDFDKRSKGLEKFGRDFKSREQLIDEIKAAQRGIVWVVFRIIGTLRSVGIGYFMVPGSSVKGNVDEACAHMV